MRWVATIGLAVGLGCPAWAQEDDTPFDRIILGAPANMDLANGSILIQAGDYDEGIEKTLRGLQDKGLNPHDRAAGLSNVCAAYAAKEMPDSALRYCTESLAIDEFNWRAYSNRSYAYWLMGRYSEAQEDLDAATALNPRARQIAQIRGMINEMRLQPSVVMEDLQ